MTLKEFFDRYGPTAAVLAVLTLLVVLLPGNAKNDEQAVNTGNNITAANTNAGETATDQTAGDNAASGGEVSAGTTGAAGGGAGTAVPGRQDAGNGVSVKGTVTNAAASAKGITFGGQGPECRPDGREKAIAITAPPCAVGWTPGADNGGSTWKGVTKDKILVIRFRSQVDAATQAALQGAGATDSREDTERIYQVLRVYQNNHNETYGREVIFQAYDASGKDDNDEAMRADAIKIAEELKAFAVMGAPPTAAAELSARKVICVCTTSLSEQFYKRNPYIVSALPTGEEYYSHIAEYWAKRLAGKPAKFAGTPDMQAQTRKFGLIYYEGTGSKVDPDYKRSRDFFIDELKKYNISLATDVGYTFDLSKAGEQSSTMIAKMKAAGVNHIAIAGDPLTPIFITQEATRQAYFPEWLITGTALIDTTFFGRTYDQAQWSHAFGISPLWVFWENVENSAGYKEYHHGKPGSPKGDEGVAINVNRTNPSILFAGIQMAGPNLTPDNFKNGILSMPPFGGTPSVPKIYFTARSPNAVKDFTEVWWDPNGTGLDETGKQGKGRLMKTDGGKRYDLGEWTPGDPHVFDASKSVYTTDNPPGGHTSGHDADGHVHKTRCLSCTS